MSETSAVGPGAGAGRGGKLSTRLRAGPWATLSPPALLFCDPLESQGAVFSLHVSPSSLRIVRAHWTNERTILLVASRWEEAEATLVRPHRMAALPE